jgi:hypothetical protein
MVAMRWRPRVRRFVVSLMVCAGTFGAGVGWAAPATVAPSTAAPPPAATAPRTEAAPGANKQVLFGDLHVHTTWSMDAFALAVPMMGGTGVRPADDACDYARWCSGLDFFALTDHAESLTPEHWAATKTAARQCAALAGSEEDPDLVPFVGFEWTQVGATPAQHYGHRNVLFPGLEEDQLPARPIAAAGLARDGMRANGVGALQAVGAALRGLPDLGIYREMLQLRNAIEDMGTCPDGVPVRDLSPDCMELAETPVDLFDKLDEWGFPALVIPHGTTWGFYTPPGATWDKGLRPSQQDADKQRLIEVYSGHGSAEEYRSWRGSVLQEGAAPVCPAPTDEHEACCWRAGELMRARCGDASADVCEAKVVKARADTLSLGSVGFRALPGTTVEDWGDCGVCTDCFAPAMDHRPGSSVQAILAGASFEDGEPTHANFGILASSDSHGARPGTGFKETLRTELTEAGGPVSKRWLGITTGRPEAPVAESRGHELVAELPSHQQIYSERQASFFTTGGLVAVHSEGRSRQAIWEALHRREVYGTSGPRILLWFDLVDESGARSPMGSEVEAAHPRFSIKALGALEQQPGCADPEDGGPPGDIATRVCLGECARPGATRTGLERLEIIRIRRQQTPDEDLADLIEDPWQTVDCPAEGACIAEVEDTDALARPALYYVRAVQVATLGVNLGGLRCADADCTEMEPCYGDWRTDDADDCLAPGQERAWSSPIFVTPPPVTPSADPDTPSADPDTPSAEPDTAPSPPMGPPDAAG